MVRYIVRRLLQAVPILFAISIFSFLLMNLAPGDPSQAFISPEMDLLDMNQIRQSLGLDVPVHERYLHWLTNVLRGNLGYSILNKRPVLDQILSRLPATIYLVGISMVLSVLISIVLGILSALHEGKWIDRIINYMCNVFISVPNFWFAMILILIFSLRLGWLPSVGSQTIGVTSWFDRLQYVIMPVIVLSINRIATMTRYVRANVLQQLTQDYVKVSLAMGASKYEVIVHDVLKNSLLPLITIIGMSLPGLVSGSFIVESIFGWPGMGLLGMNAIFSYDYPLIMATTMISSILLVIGNLLADIINMLVDPRIGGDVS